MGYCIGIDGCRGGWVAAVLGDGLSLRYARSLEEVRDLIQGADMVLIDMPMGIPSDGTSDRTCDREARRYLKKRKMSIFPIPSRQAVYSDSYEEALALNREVTGKGLSKQAYNLFPKIREVDSFTRKDLSLLSKIYEGHPELSFTRIRGRDMDHSKKKPEGVEERLLVLESHLSGVRALVDEFLSGYPRKTMVIDDVVDSIALVLSLLISETRGYSSLPDKEIRDGCEIPMRIFLLGGGSHDSSQS